MTHVAALTRADHDEWLALWFDYLEFYESELPAAQTLLTFERILDPTVDIHGAIARDDTGRAIGIVHWLTHPATWSAGPYCYLEDLFVHPDARGAGTASALIAHVRDWAHKHGAAKVYWLTKDDNRRARALYDRVATATGFVHYEIPID